MPDVYNRNSVTKKGYNLLAESIATKKPITFTKVVVGDGDDTGLDINTMTGVVSPKMELPIGNGEKGGDGEYVIQAVLSNKTLEHSFFPKEVGLFAKCGDGEEVLYSYSNGGNNVGLMPDKNTPINAEIYNIRTKIGNATNITFVTSDDTYVTKGELTKHNADANAHDNRFNAIIQQVNNMITGVDNSEGQQKAPTLALVKEIQKGYLPITGGDLQGEITVNGKAAKTIVDSWYSDDKSQYWVKYSDGELVQMITKDNPNNTGITVTIINLFQPFIDINYFVNAVYETHSTRRPNSNTSLSNSITAVDNTIADSNFSPKTKTRFAIATDTMSLCRTYCVGRWK